LGALSTLHPLNITMAQTTEQKLSGFWKKVTGKVPGRFVCLLNSFH
jgi:hypothetical protein